MQPLLFLLRLDLRTVEGEHAERERDVVHVEIFDLRVTRNDIEDSTDCTFVLGTPDGTNPANLIFNVERCHEVERNSRTFAAMSQSAPLVDRVHIGPPLRFFKIQPIMLSNVHIGPCLTW
jgi:hypothetical protein